MIVPEVPHGPGDQGHPETGDAQRSARKTEMLPASPPLTRKTALVDGIGLLARVRKIALGLPGVTEMASHGAPCFFIGVKLPICYFHDHHRGDNRVTIWCPAAPGVADELASVDPERFFTPQPSRSGVFASWIGMVLDPPPNRGVDWIEVAAILEEAFRLRAPHRLVAELDDRH